MPRVWTDDFGAGSNIANYTGVDHVSITGGKMVSSGTASQKYYSGALRAPAEGFTGGKGTLNAKSNRADAAYSEYGSSLFEVRDGTFVIALYHGYGPARDQLQLVLDGGSTTFDSAAGVLTPGVEQNVRLEWQWSTYNEFADVQYDGWVKVYIEDNPTPAITATGLQLFTTSAKQLALAQRPVPFDPNNTPWTGVWIGPMGSADDFTVDADPIPAAPEGDSSMPVYDADATSVNKPVLTPGRPLLLWDGTASPPEDVSNGEASRQFCMHRVHNLPAVLSVEVEFSGAPGAFDLEFQTADTDEDKYYVKHGTSLTTVNSSQVGRMQFTDVVAKFGRLYMKTLTNAVQVTARVF